MVTIERAAAEKTVAESWYSDATATLGDRLTGAGDGIAARVRLSIARSAA